MQTYPHGTLVIVIDCADLDRAADFWCGVLGYHRPHPRSGVYLMLIPPARRRRNPPPASRRHQDDQEPAPPRPPHPRPRRRGPTRRRTRRDHDHRPAATSSTTGPGTSSPTPTATSSASSNRQPTSPGQTDPSPEHCRIWLYSIKNRCGSALYSTDRQCRVPRKQDPESKSRPVARLQAVPSQRT